MSASGCVIETVSANVIASVRRNVNQPSGNNGPRSGRHVRLHASILILRVRGWGIAPGTTSCVLDGSGHRETGGRSLQGFLNRSGRGQRACSCVSDS